MAASRNRIQAGQAARPIGAPMQAACLERGIGGTGGRAAAAPHA